MIHVGTAHYLDPRWIDVQRRYLERNTGEPHRLYASLDRVPSRESAKFDVALDHSDVDAGAREYLRIDAKLNLLAERILDDAEPGDEVVFMHGDTLPLPGWAPRTRELVAGHGLAAIRRDEIGEPIPHWSFCATTAELWRELDATWSRGERAWDFCGDVMTDTGGMLMDALEREGVDWHPILRTNAVDLNPLWFGVYGDLVYHHGAGFRTPMSKKDASTYRHLPIGIRNAIGVGKRVRNTALSRRLYRQASRDNRFYVALTRRDPL